MPDETSGLKTTSTSLSLQKLNRSSCVTRRVFTHGNSCFNRASKLIIKHHLNLYPRAVRSASLPTEYEVTREKQNRCSSDRQQQRFRNPCDNFRRCLQLIPF